MAEKEFNLLREPWVRVMRADCTVEEVSLPEALCRAHEYRGLAGELPTQNAAVLRLLLAVLHTVFERVNAAGEEELLADADAAYDRWAELWESGRFPEQPLQDYFQTQVENFWLFHPQRPFWQIAAIPAEASRPQSEPVQKLNGAISESGNKARLFAERSGEGKTTLCNAEIARWLICMNQYDDNTLKTGLGVALLGQFAAVLARGSTLFETLMLNFVLLNRDGELWEETGRASWEQEIPFNEEPQKIAYPNDPVAMLSYHARYGRLMRENGKLVCYKSPKGGICYEQVSKNEPMAMWKRDRKTEQDVLRRSLNGQQAWREFGTIFDKKAAQPAIVWWHSLLEQNGCFPENYTISYEFVEITYDQSQHSSVENIETDSLTLHLNLLGELGEVYRERITDEISRCDRIAGHIGRLAGDLFLASGGDTEKTAAPMRAAKERYYFAIDVPFRKWLQGLDAGDDGEQRDKKCADWRAEAERIAQAMARKMAADAGQPAFVGKMVPVAKDKKKYYTSSLALQWFRIHIKKLD